MKAPFPSLARATVPTADGGERLLPVKLLYTATAIAFAYPFGRDLSDESFPLQASHATVAAALAPKKASLRLPARTATGRFVGADGSAAGDEPADDADAPAYEAERTSLDAVRRNTAALKEHGLVTRRRKPNDETGAEDGEGTPYLYVFPADYWAAYDTAPLDTRLDTELRAVWATRPDPHEWALYVRLRCGGAAGEWSDLARRTGLAPGTLRRWLRESSLMTFDDSVDHPDGGKAHYVVVGFHPPLAQGADPDRPASSRWWEDLDVEPDNVPDFDELLDRMAPERSERLAVAPAPTPAPALAPAATLVPAGLVAEEATGSEPPASLVIARRPEGSTVAAGAGARERASRPDAVSGAVAPPARRRARRAERAVCQGDAQRALFDA